MRCVSPSRFVFNRAVFFNRCFSYSCQFFRPDLGAPSSLHLFSWLRACHAQGAFIPFINKRAASTYLILPIKSDRRRFVCENGTVVGIKNFAELHFFQLGGNFSFFTSNTHRVQSAFCRTPWFVFLATSRFIKTWGQNLDRPSVWRISSDSFWSISSFTPNYERILSGRGAFHSLSQSLQSMLTRFIATGVHSGEVPPKTLMCSEKFVSNT